MPIFESNAIAQVALHRVGNQATNEGCILSQKCLPLTEQLQDLFVQYFLSPFKAEEYYRLYHDDDLAMNRIYQLATDIFASHDNFIDHSNEIARCLYEASSHPNIKGGDFFVVYFSQCQLNGEVMDAIGLFKAENKDFFLKVVHSNEVWSTAEGDPNADAIFNVEPHKGINIHKLDKGAIIFNTEAEKGYVVSVVDNTNRSLDALYWKDTFLQIRQREDEYYNTHAELTAYKKFVTEELPQHFEVSKADQADLLNKSVNYFKQNDSFDIENFTQEVIEQPEVIESFNQYREQYQEDNDVVLQDSFNINESAVKKQARAFKSVIKLDKNFHIYVHGNRDLIEQGEDERGKFYKVYYSEES